MKMERDGPVTCVWCLQHIGALIPPFSDKYFGHCPSCDAAITKISEKMLSGIELEDLRVLALLKRGSIDPEDMRLG